MKAIVQDTYGSPDEVLTLEDIAAPVAKDDEVLVRVHAASVHVGDWILVRGVPYIARMAVGLRKPKNRVPGTDIAGTVEAVGKDVTQLRPGDEVFGWCTGAFAEYACAGEDHFVPKPANLTFEQAAAVGVSASTALQLLRDQGKVQPGQKVLINGASGGLGTFAVQIAKAFGAEVTGVCSTRNVDMVRSIGADHVIDYTQEDFTQGWAALRLHPRQRGEPFVVRHQTRTHPHRQAAVQQRNCGRALARHHGHRHQNGRGVTVRAPAVGPDHQIPEQEDLVVLKGLIEAGKVTPVIDGTYPLSGTAQAIGHVGEGHARGTVVITV